MLTHTFKTLAFVATCASLVACGNHSKSKYPRTAPGTQAAASVDPLYPVAINLTARDGWALSSAGSDTLASSVQHWTDQRTHTQIVTWVDGGDDLNVSFTPGDGAYTPPVSIRARRFGGAQAPQVVGVLFFDTSGHADALARSRDGDAIVLFLDDDPGDSSHTAPEATTRLFSAYFDRSAAILPTTTQTDAISGQTLEFQYGWQVIALPVDDDPDDRDAQSTRLDVSLAGWVSNAAHRTHVGSAQSSGDPTSFAYAVWSQGRPSNNYESRLQLKEFDLSTEGFSFPSGQPSVTSLRGSDWIAHDGMLLTVNPDTSDLTAAIFLGNAPPTLHVVEGDAPLPDPSELYGPDESLGHWAALFVKNGEALLATLTANGPSGLTRLNPTGTTNSAAGLDSRIVRDGTWIAASWLEDDEFLSCAVDASRDLSQGADLVSNPVVQATLSTQFDHAYQIELDYRHGVQANSRRMNWIYQDDQACFVTGLEVTLSGVAAPVARRVGHSVVSRVPPLGPLQQRAVCYDRGDADGNANVVFLAEKDPLQTGDRRLFHYSGSEVDVSQTADQISSIAQPGQQEALGSLTVCTIPVTPDVTRYPSYAGTHASLLFTEQREGTGEAALFHVAWDKVNATLSPSTLVSLDVPREVERVTCLRSINALDVYFGQAGHVLFNSWVPAMGWFQTGGSSAPLVVDDYHPEEANNGWVVLGDRDGVATGSEDGPGAAVFYDKTFGPGGDRRLLVRTRR